MSLKIEFITKNYLKDIVSEPIPAYKFFPKWYQELPKKTSKCPFRFDKSPYNIQYDSKLGIKGCLGIQDFLKVGYIIPSWSNFIFREDINESLYVNWLENPWPNEYVNHEMNQFPSMNNPPIYKHFGKLLTPWIIKTSPGVSCLITNPVWHRKQSFTTSTGIFHTDQTTLHLPWFFEWNYKIESGMDLDTMSYESQVIEKGDPLILIIPFYRKQFESSVKYVDEKDFDHFIMKQSVRTHNLKFNDDLYRSFRKKLGRLFK
jgi:hypothetical protein